MARNWENILPADSAELETSVQLAAESFQQPKRAWMHLSLLWRLEMNASLPNALIAARETLSYRVQLNYPQFPGPQNCDNNMYYFKPLSVLVSFLLNHR